MGEFATNGLGMAIGFIQGFLDESDRRRQRKQLEQQSQGASEQDRLSNLVKLVGKLPEAQRSKILGPEIEKLTGQALPQQERKGVAEQGLAMFENLPTSVQRDLITDPETEELQRGKLKSQIRATDALANQRNRRSGGGSGDLSADDVRQILEAAQKGGIVNRDLQAKASQLLMQILGGVQSEAPKSAPAKTNKKRKTIPGLFD